MYSLSLFSALLLWSVPVYSDNFTFSYSAATQCDDFEVSWTGGVPPYSLTIVPSFGAASTVSIPTEAFENNRGTFKTAMKHEKDRKIVVIMSDGGGFATGGVSPVITVGAQTGTTQCNATTSGGEFEFEANERLIQCGNFPFSGYAYAGAQLPVTITGFVPGGSVFILRPGATDTSYNWLVDVATGTTLGFYLEDALGRQGGTTEFMPVQESNDASCLDAQSPASFSNAPSMTSASLAAPTVPTDPQLASASSKGLKRGALAGVVVGPIVALVTVVAPLWFCLRKRRSGGTFPRRPRKDELDLADGDKVESGAGLSASSSMRPDYSAITPRDPALNPLIGQGAWSPQTSPTAFEFAQSPSSATSSQFSPTVRPDAVSIYAASSAYGGTSAYGSGYEPAAFARSDTQSSAAQQKAAQAGVRVLAPPRVILHTDLEDELLPPPPPEEVIELPPQYAERRRAATGQPEEPNDGTHVATGSGLLAADASS